MNIGSIAAILGQWLCMEWNSIRILHARWKNRKYIEVKRKEED